MIAEIPTIIRNELVPRSRNIHGTAGRSRRSLRLSDPSRGSGTSQATRPIEIRSRHDEPRKVALYPPSSAKSPPTMGPRENPRSRIVE